MKIKAYDEWRKTLTVLVPPDADTAILMEIEMALLDRYDDYKRDMAFENEMSGCNYGEEETRDAKAWFDAGWASHKRSLLRGSE